MEEVITSYYLRMRVADRPGVLADITRILADLSISIDAMVQKEPAEARSRWTSSCSPRDAREERQRRDCEDRGAGRGEREGDAHQAGRAGKELSEPSLPY